MKDKRNKIPKHIKDKLSEFVKELKESPFLPLRKRYDIKPLKTEKDTYRIRFGKYRIKFIIYKKARKLDFIEISDRKSFK